MAEEVVRTAPCPVLTAGDELDSHSVLERLKRVLVPVDFSDDSREALRFAKEMAALHKAGIELVHVVEQRSYPAFYEEKVQAVYHEIDIESVIYRKLEEMDE